MENTNELKKSIFVEIKKLLSIFNINTQYLNIEDFFELDELEKLELALHVENLFKIYIPDNEPTTWKSYNDVINSVISNMKFPLEKTLSHSDQVIDIMNKENS